MPRDKTFYVFNVLWRTALVALGLGVAWALDRLQFNLPAVLSLLLVTVGVAAIASLPTRRPWKAVADVAQVIYLVVAAPAFAHALGLIRASPSTRWVALAVVLSVIHFGVQSGRTSVGARRSGVS